MEFFYYTFVGFLIGFSNMIFPSFPRFLFVQKPSFFSSTVRRFKTDQIDLIVPSLPDFL